MQANGMSRVARLSELRDGGIVRVKAGDAELVIVRDGDVVSAFAAACPHAGAPLEEGAVCHRRLVCPWHKATFSLIDGSIVEPPALEPLTRYPVLIEGDDVLIAARAIEGEPDVERIDGRQMLILGSGAAGTAAAFALREAEFAGTITMIGEEAPEPYDRTVLSKFVLADMSPTDVPPLRRDADWKRLRIDRKEATIARLDAAGRRVHLSDGTEMGYDAAILATGATPNVPKIPGVALGGVHPLRSLQDAAFIVALARPGARAVIVGASFIGLEAASALRGRGVRVIVVAPETIPFERQFGPEIGAMFRRLHEANGTEFRFGAKVDRFEGTEVVDTVVLGSGERLPADLVVLGVGVSPTTTFVEGVRKAEDGGILVDASMRATDGLYVAGDSARFPYGGAHIRVEHWRVAQQHGRVAAANVAGLDRRFTAPPFFWTYHFGNRFEYIGHAEHWDRVHIDGDLESQRFVAFQVRDDAVAGVIACQREHATALLIERMREPLPLAEAIGLARNA
jgi:NADPH-dependent 2,4-dienoyl-CoA reductase/sulfur reductase-like enzyme/nitrite reductase/ring-hydroxylating ferredoxin subunit